MMIPMIFAIRKKKTVILKEDEKRMHVLAECASRTGVSEAFKLYEERTGYTGFRTRRAFIATLA